MDDVLTAVPADQVDRMLTHINSINQNIQFTSEREQGHVPFLDVMILHSDDGSLSTKVYHKPTHTDQYLQFSSHSPQMGCCLHLTQESFSLFYKQSGMRGEIICEGDPPTEYTQNIFSSLSAHHENTQEDSLPPKGSLPIVFLMMTSPALCTRSIVVTVMPAM